MTAGHGRPPKKKKGTTSLDAQLEVARERKRNARTDREKLAADKEIAKIQSKIDEQ